MTTLKTSINYGGYRRFAQFCTRTGIYPEQIDAIVAKAVDSFAERQAKMDAAVAKKPT